MATNFERVKKIVVDQLGVEEEKIVPLASFVDDLGADPLDLIELTMSLEEEFSDPSRKINFCPFCVVASFSHSGRALPHHSGEARYL